MSDFRPTEPLSTGIASGRYGGKPGIADGPLWVEMRLSLRLLAGFGNTPQPHAGPVTPEAARAGLSRHASPVSFLYGDEAMFRQGGQ